MSRIHRSGLTPKGGEPRTRIACHAHLGGVDKGADVEVARAAAGIDARRRPPDVLGERFGAHAAIFRSLGLPLGLRTDLRAADSASSSRVISTPCDLATAMSVAQFLTGITFPRPLGCS